MVATVPFTTVSTRTGRLLLVDEVQADPVPAGARIAYLREVVFAQHGTGEGETPPPERQAEEEEEEEERDEDEEARARGRAPLTSAELDRFRMIMEQERQQMVEEVATNNGPLGIRSEPQPDIGRTQDLEMVASHANVEGLRLPPDLVALAYDRNDGDIVNAIMNLTEPIFRRQLERELAELAERHAEEEEEEEEEEPPDARELDLWLLESQVPECTRERAERAYEQSNEDVSRALPLARMSTLLADRDAMIAFLREQHHEATLEEAEVSYEFMEGDVVEAAAHMVRGIRWRANEAQLSTRRMHTVRLRTVFHLALLYRERYCMEPEEDTLGLPAGVAVRAFTATAEEAVQHGLVRARPTPAAEAENVPPAPDREAFEEQPSAEQRAAALDFTAARFGMAAPDAAAPPPAPDAVAELNENLAVDAVATRGRLLAALRRATTTERPADFTGPTGTPWRYTRERGWTPASDEERADVAMAAAAGRARRFQRSQVSASWGAPAVAELRQQFDRSARAWHDAQGARDLELQQLRRRLAETEGWPEGQVFIRNRLRALLTETLVAHAEREHNLNRQFPLSPPWIVVLQTVRRWDGRGTSEAEMREVLDDAGRLRRQALGAAAAAPDLAAGRRRPLVLPGGSRTTRSSRRPRPSRCRTPRPCRCGWRRRARRTPSLRSRSWSWRGRGRGRGGGRGAVARRRAPTATCSRAGVARRLPVRPRADARPPRHPPGAAAVAPLPRAHQAEPARRAGARGRRDGRRLPRARCSARARTSTS